jgi:hypothetical protein
MGRKKGKQSGDFHCKKLNAEHLHKIYIDNAAEANRYRNPVSSNILGKGLGYRSATATNESVGRWDTNGRSCNQDKWSSIFANRSSTRSTAPLYAGTRQNQNAARGLAHLRHLLEDRRTEDRFHDRQFRLALQRSRLRESHLSFGTGIRESTEYNNKISTSDGISAERNEPGWIISQFYDAKSESIYEYQPSSNLHRYKNINHLITKDMSRVPTLQSLAAQVLGPLLPVYVAACGHEFIGECLKSASPEILAQLSISLAKSSLGSDENEATFATTDGVVKALVHSGVATGLVLKGAPLAIPDDCQLNGGEGYEENDNLDTRWLSNQGLLALCPRLLPQMDVSPDAYNDDWETLDVDLDLTARMAGCLHLRCLELIDIPLCSPMAQGGITLVTLRHVLQSCPGITHLGLAGCFYNWADMGSACQVNEDVSLLLCGTKLISQTSSEKDSDHQANQQLSKYDFSFDGDNVYEMKGVHQMLPELQVLDVSHCTWVTPMMVFRLLLQYREGGIKCEHTSKTDDWAIKCADQTSEVRSQISLEQLSVMGCNLTSDDINMIKEWISHSLFGSVKLLTSL